MVFKSGVRRGGQFSFNERKVAVQHFFLHYFIHEMKQPNQVQRWIFPPLNASQAPQATHWEHFALLATAAAKQQKLNCSFLLKIISKEIEFITSIAYEMLKIK